VARARCFLVTLLLALPENAPHRRWSILALLFTTRVALGFQFQTMGSVAEPVAYALHHK
jgi:hypothetical protein